MGPQLDVGLVLSPGRPSTGTTSTLKARRGFAALTANLSRLFSGSAKRRRKAGEKRQKPLTEAGGQVICLEDFKKENFQ